MYMYMKSCTCIYEVMYMYIVHVYEVMYMYMYNVVLFQWRTIIMILRVIISYKDSIVTILHIQNSVILIQTTEYNHITLFHDFFYEETIIIGHYINQQAFYIQWQNRNWFSCEVDHMYSYTTYMVGQLVQGSHLARTSIHFYKVYYL